MGIIGRAAPKPKHYPEGHVPETPHLGLTQWALPSRPVFEKMVSASYERASERSCLLTHENNPKTQLALAHSSKIYEKMVSERCERAWASEQALVLAHS